MLDEMSQVQLQLLHEQNKASIAVCEQALLFVENDRERRTIVRTHAQFLIVGAVLSRVQSRAPIAGIELIHRTISEIFERFVIPIARRAEPDVEPTLPGDGS